MTSWLLGMTSTPALQSLTPPASQVRFLVCFVHLLSQHSVLYCQKNSGLAPASQALSSESQCKMFLRLSEQGRQGTALGMSFCGLLLFELQSEHCHAELFAVSQPTLHVRLPSAGHFGCMCTAFA